MLASFDQGVALMAIAGGTAVDADTARRGLFRLLRPGPDEDAMPAVSAADGGEEG